MKTRSKINFVLIFSLVWTALDYLVAALTSEMSYMTNDDAGIQNALSGITTGEPYPFHQYISPILGAFISGLYRLFSGVQWWYVWSLLVVAVGIFLIHYCLLKTAVKNKVFLPIAIGILIFLDLGFFIYPIANISFTIVPAFLGTGIVAVLFYLAEADSVKHEKLLYAGTIIGFVLVFCQRRQTGIVLLCFILMAYLYYFITRSENVKKAVVKFLITAVVFVAIAGSLTAVNRTTLKRINGEEFVEYNSARAQFMDYHHDIYEENPELYTEAGWNRDDYYLITGWCFIDDKATTESFDYLSENSKYVSAGRIAQLKNIYHSKVCMEILLLYAASGVIALFLIIARFNKKRFLFLLLNNVGAVGLFGYQILTGRALYRSIFIFLLPAVVINLILSFRKEMDTKPVRYAFNIITLVLGVLCIVPTLRGTFDSGHNASNAYKKTLLNEVDEYTLSHPDNFYIIQIGMTDNIDPFRLFKGPVNSIYWGGSYYYSDLYYKQIEAQGFSELTGDTFKNDNVYMIISTDIFSDGYYDYIDDPLRMYMRYLEKNYGAVGLVQEDKITGGAFVYHFVFEENAKYYDTYYDIVDGPTVMEK